MTETLYKDINEHFKLPIYYNDKKKKLDNNIIQDLELVETVDPSGTEIYQFYVNNDNPFSNAVTKQLSHYYTHDTSFLKDTQNILKTYTPLTTKYTDYSYKYDNIIKTWNEIKGETGFKDKYYYIDWPALEFLNKSEGFLQFMSLYNMASPVISLLMPIIILIIPFFIIKLKGLHLSIDQYIDVLKIIAKQHAIGQLFTEFGNVSSQQKIYLLVSAAFYIFNIYQNILTCIRFNSNMVKIHNYLNEVRMYLDHTIKNIDNFLNATKDYATYSSFINVVLERRKTLVHLQNKVSSISEYKLNTKKFSEIGHILKYFYELYDDQLYNDTLLFSFGFNGYIDCLEGLCYNIKERNIHFATLIEKEKKKICIFKKSYYAPLKNEKHVKNTVKLDKNLIITGPNASGKTTVLKSTIINAIFTQQFGCGFYQSAKYTPFDFIHCYMNIPDTSGRDSLFQAEARRCKEIIDVINQNKYDSHFCVFDELYSGTNPDEAVTSSIAFMEYITKNKNIKCVLTTHFIKVCKKLDGNKNMRNMHMKTEKDNNRIRYTYILKKGISEIKGGINVLYDMNYPKEIIENCAKEN